MTTDISLLVDDCEKFAHEFIALSSDLLEDRFTSFLESCKTIEHASSPGELDLALESALITLEEHTNFFKEVIEEFQLELLRREELVIESFWQLAENRSQEKAGKHSREQEANPPSEEKSGPTLPPPSSEKAPDTEARSPATALDTIEQLIVDSETLIKQARTELLSLDVIQAQLNEVETHIRTATFDWYRINASAINQQQRSEAAALKRKIDSLAVFARELAGLERKSPRNASKAVVPKPKLSKIEAPREQKIKRHQAQPARRSPQPPQPEPSDLPKIRPDIDSTRARTSGREYSNEYFEFLEEDYFNYRSLWNHFFKTSQVPEERARLTKLHDAVAQRREDLSRWRNSQSFLGADPVSLKSVFAQFKFASPDTGEEARTRKKIQKILEDMKKNPGHSQSVKGTHALNRKVFLTAGRINPRARR